MGASTTLTRLLFLLRSIGHANGTVSTFGTHFEYFEPSTDWFLRSLHGKAIVFESNCSCGLNLTCTIPAGYISKNRSEYVSFDGLQVGCTPSESLLASTLASFYQASCIQTLLRMANENRTNPTAAAPSALSLNTSRFSVDLEVSDLVKGLFVEDWSIVRNYSSYYGSCLPIQCSYKYYQQLDSLYTVTYLLSLYGGLTIIFTSICPRMIYVLVKAAGCCKKRSTSVAVAPANIG